MMYLLYVSEAAYPMETSDLLDILTVSRRNNLRDDITGLLLYKDRQFIQLLEGPKSNVIALHRRLMTDPRHTSVRTMLSGPLQERQFNNWAMAFYDLSKVDQRHIPGLSDFLQKPFDEHEFLKTPNRAYRFLLNFKDMPQHA
jgi:hypothetical protein